MGYFSILVGVFSFSIAMKAICRTTLFDSAKQGAVILGFFFVVGVIWDSYAVYSGHWFFNDKNLLGIRVGLLPIEEYLFFVVLPVFIITLYQILRSKITSEVRETERAPRASAAPPYASLPSESAVSRP